jgi:hypothetical protein
VKQVRQPLCRFMGGGRTQHQQRFAKSLSHAGSGQKKRRESFGKDATSTVRLATEKSVGPEQDPKRIAPTRHVTKRPVIATVVRR